MNKAKLQIDNISKTYGCKGDQAEVLSKISVDIPENSFICLLGPSGCGKTTLLRILAGLLKPTSGTVRLDGQEISKPTTKCGLVPQAYTLFPWLTVAQNIAFGLKLKHLTQNEIKSIVDEYLELIGLPNHGAYYPKELSGGMQQRIAIARTLANEPEVLLMDEPFGALDSQTRSQMQEFILQIWEAKRKTVVFVTHDIDEAIFLSDQLYILSASPAHIKETVAVKLARPRTEGLKMRTSFLEYKKYIHSQNKLDISQMPM